MTRRSLGSVPERRARLARRHLLAAPARAETAGEVAEALIALHGTDPASVYLAAWARSADSHRAIGPDAVGRALYETGELVRMLGMRRTMFVVPAGLAPVIQASCTDQIAQRMRSGLVRDLAAAGVAPDAGRWLDEVGDATVRALTARGAATGAELARDEPRLRTQLTYAEGKNYGGTVNITTRVLMLLSAERHIARGRPRGGWTSSQYEWTPAVPWPAVSAAAARAELARRWLLAFGPCPPRNQPRSRQPMGVGSRAGSSAAHGPVAGSGSSSPASTMPGVPSRSTSVVVSWPSAARAWPAVQPVHHCRSETGAGPNASSQRRASWARASAGDPAGHGSAGVHSYWLEVQPPRGRPRAMRRSAESSMSTRVVMLAVPP